MTQNISRLVVVFFSCTLTEQFAKVMLMDKLEGLDE